MGKYELLAPAGGFSQLVAAVNAGADAVYFGLKEFSMRDNAKNFSIEDLDKIGKICIEKGVKKYLTINVIIYEEELEKVRQTLEKVKRKIDSIICWDLSVVELCREMKIPFHISTQASVSNSEAAKFYKNLGAERVVFAREISLKQIKEISSKVDLGIECFCHGAMCVAVSGRCFMSQELYGRSANRGQCTQVCRRSYTIKDNEGKELKLGRNTVMSAKDLCTLPFISEMKKAGIISFKIEGRSRDARYVDTVVRVYRKALDKDLNKKEIEEGLKKLETVYTKGFSSGFYLGVPTNDNFSNAEHSLATEKKEYVGKVMNYFSRSKVMTVLIQDNGLKVGNKICVIGKTTGIVYSTIKRMEISSSEVKSVDKGKEVGVKIGLVRKGDEVYVIRGN